MNTNPIVPEALRTAVFDVSVGLDGNALFTHMAALDAAQSDQARNSGFYWIFTAAPGDSNADSLMVGVRGKIGVLEWFTPTRGYIPTNGVNTDHVDYYTFDAHVMVMEPGAEVPIEQVHAAVVEFVRTGQRPTCVQWREFDPFKP